MVGFLMPVHRPLKVILIKHRPHALILPPLVGEYRLRPRIHCCRGLDSSEPIGFDILLLTSAGADIPG